MDFDGQYLDGYRVANADDVPGANARTLAFQGASRIPHQIYFDLSRGAVSSCEPEDRSTSWRSARAW